MYYLDPNQRGGTQVDVKISYNPPAGMIGHSAARILGADPLHALDSDLARMKAYTETGQAPPDESRGKHPRIVDHQQVARRQQVRQVRESVMRDGAVLPAQPEQPRRAALGGRLLGNQLRGKVEVELGHQHGSECTREPSVEPLGASRRAARGVHRRRPL